MINAINRPKKRLFIILISVSLLITSISTYGVWKISFLGLSNISEHLPVILGIILIALLFSISFGFMGIVFSILGWPTIQCFHRQAWAAINILFPMAVIIGKVIDVNKEKIERSFIEVSNQIIRNRGIKIHAKNLLLVTPHCLQEETCPHKITRDVKNCKKCGRCQIGDLLKLSEKYGFSFAVVTGGTLARQIIKKVKPKAVLSIACERDLTSGIQDIYPLPVIGVLNQRPFGPCNNTRVNVNEVEKAIKEFLI
ncbi:DUF116 domain-containing protein [Anaerosinus sp.]|uniref:DUF116 domain-containing protein n=1 Tax=Selenobaculum sp. TaxID=3074374 RepID=UPI0015AB7BB3